MGDKDTGYFNSIVSFDEYVETNTEPVLTEPEYYSGHPTKNGMYARYLRQWFKYFDRSKQILILDYEELKNDPGSYMKRIGTFLMDTKLLRAAESGKGFRKKNSSSTKNKQALPGSAKTQQKLVDLYR